MGTTNMRSGIPIPRNFHPYHKYLRDAGYYLIHRDKGDYNFSGDSPSKYFHESHSWNDKFWEGPDADNARIGGNRAATQPFFCHVNLGYCHESAQARLRDYQPSHEELASIALPPYHMDNRQARSEWARYYHSIKETDAQIGQILEKLEKDGLADDTIVFCFGDHGGTLPRSKRFLYETGTRTHFIVRFPEKYAHLLPAKAGSVSDRLVSFVDFGPTVLTLAGVETPQHMEGKPILGQHVSAEPEFVFLAKDRVDSFYDLSRAVRSGRYRYVRNYTPQKILWQRADYPENLFKSVALHREDYLAGRCDRVQASLWLPKSSEEFYDVENDPWEVNNLINDPAHQDEIAKMRAANDRHVREILDPGFVPEGELKNRCNPRFTPYDLVREEGFPYELIVQTAELASTKDQANLPVLIERMEHEEASIRFWAAMGCAAMEEKAGDATDALRRLLTDESIDVRCAAAEAMARLGSAKEGIPVLIVDMNVESPWYHRVISTLTDLDCRYPGILTPYREPFAQVELAHWRHVKTYNFLLSQYDLPLRDMAAAKREYEQK
jgi:arylsulfatase A-like enzyme